MADQDDFAPLTIKNVPREVRDIFRNCALRENVSQAELLGQAVRNEDGRLRGLTVIPPGQTEMQPVSGHTEIAIGHPDGQTLDRLMDMALRYAQAAAGLPEATRRHLSAMLEDHCRVARGLPPKKRRWAGGNAGNVRTLISADPSTSPASSL